MKTPDEIKRELSSKIDRLMAEMFPGAKREAGGRYVMADLRGDAEGRSCNVFKAKNSAVSTLPRTTRPERVATS
jgi:hypothetical protein